MSKPYYTATAVWTSDALAAHPNEYFNGYEKILGRFESEDEARAALAPHLERPEISHGFVFYLRDARRNQVEQLWRKTVDKPGHVDTPLQSLIRAATVNVDGTDYLDR
jgi:hypothetical protein